MKHIAGNETKEMLAGMLCGENCGLLLSTMHQFSESLGIAIDAKDPYTKTHSVEVAEVAFALAGWFGLNNREAESIHIGGHLHDIGKIGVPDSVLRKTGSLTEQEWALMRKHPQIGANILKPIQEIAALGIPEMVLHHHEAFDGRGYPHGLAGDSIPFGARIIAVADSLSAMLGNRAYRPAMDFKEAMEEVYRCMGTQFDPSIIKVLFQYREEVEDFFKNQAPGGENAFQNGRDTLPDGRTEDEITFCDGV